MAKPLISVFTEPWTDPLLQLADKLAGLGFEGVELAVRDGYQVLPESVGTDLPKAVQQLEVAGLKTPSIAGNIDEATIDACGAAGVGIIRICAPINMVVGYQASFDAYRRAFDAVIPALERNNVSIGVQNHYGRHIASAVLDMGYCAVDGEPVEMAVDIARPHMNGLVNFKSACHVRANGPELDTEYMVHWTTHEHGGYNWRALVEELHQIGFTGTFCMPAEYSQQAGLKGQRMGDDVLPFVRRDIANLRNLIDEIYQ